MFDVLGGLAGAGRVSNAALAGWRARLARTDIAFAKYLDYSSQVSGFKVITTPNYNICSLKSLKTQKSIYRIQKKRHAVAEMNTRNEQDPERSDDGTGSVPAQRRSVPIVEHRIDSRELFAATREVTIAHGADVYRLRLTAQNKLILTK